MAGFLGRRVLRKLNETNVNLRALADKRAKQSLSPVPIFMVSSPSPVSYLELMFFMHNTNETEHHKQHKKTVDQLFMHKNTGYRSLTSLIIRTC